MLAFYNDGNDSSSFCGSTIFFWCYSTVLVKQFREICNKIISLQINNVYNEGIKQSRKAIRKGEVYKMSLKGKRVVVTGGSKGLGLGIVKRLCAEGANIIMTYNTGDVEEAQKAADVAGVEFAAYQADLSDMDQVLKLADEINQFPDVYGLVNNAGICYFEDFFSISQESYDKTFNVNMKAVFLLTQKITEKMVERKIQGRVVNFSSITAVSGSATQVHYGAAKSAVSGFTHMAAEALGQYGITVNAIMPGPTPTKHNSDYLKLEDTKKELCSRMPMRRYGEPSYIADGVVYFLGEGAAWTTGVLLPVDGGYLAK